jgi:hypothetical protein
VRRGLGGKRDKACFYFEEGSIFRSLCWPRSKSIDDGPIKWLLMKRKKKKTKSDRTHYYLNRKHE